MKLTVEQVRHVAELARLGITDEEMERKRLQYLAHGTGEVWIIYPKTRTMLVGSRDRTSHIEASETYRCEIMAVEITPECRTVDV